MPYFSCKQIAIAFLIMTLSFSLLAIIQSGQAGNLKTSLFDEPKSQMIFLDDSNIDQFNLSKTTPRHPAKKPNLLLDANKADIEF